MQVNPVLNTDSYKYSHFLQYPEGTEFVYSYIESRGGEYDSTLFFGLQAFIKEYMLKPFTKQDIDEAELIVTAHGEPFNREGFEYILKRYNGYWPVRIRAVPEGTVVPTKNILVDIINTDPLCYWVPSFLETALLRAVWYPTTVATQELYLKKVIKKYLEETANDSAMAGIGFKLNDFGARGASSWETSALGGLAHLVTFQGTDNVPALQAAIKYYNATGPVGYSIPAAEHSTMTSWGGKSGEVDAMRNMVKKFGKPGALVACVSDSYNLWDAISNYWGAELLEEVKASGATIVVRPDSGNPLVVPVQATQLLMDKVGYEVNSKGYKILPSYFRLIQGDGVNPESIERILSEFRERNLSTDNLAFGMGGAMLQQVNRDTQKFAMKCSAIMVNGEWRDVFKDPITDKGKASKKGMLDLVKDNHGYRTVKYGGWEENSYSVMRTVYETGKLYVDDTFEDVRNRVEL